ncbi:MAG: CHAT domain-containing protein, partial [Bacteroidota bacterium]
GLYEDARINYEHAVRIFEKSYGEYDHRVGVTYTNIGACYANQLEFYSAIQYHNKAYTIFQQILEPNHPFISALYVDFSDSYAKMGKHQESLEFGKKALDVLKSRYPTKEGRDHREMGIAYYRYGNTLIKIGQYKDAIAHLNSAIDEFNLMEEKQLLSHVYVLLGMTNSYLQKKQEAENNFQHAIDILAKEKTTPKNLHLVYALSAYAEFCNDEKKYSQALELCNKAMAQLGIATKGQYDFYFAENLYSVDYLTDLLHERGMALWGLYKKEGDQNILHTALKNYSFLTDVYQLVIQESKAERSKLLQLPSLAEYYEKAVVCALELFEKTKDIRFKHQAFAFAEQSKAILLRHYIHDSQARSYAGIPSTIIQQERRLKEKISFIEKRMTELDNTAENDSLFKLLQRAHFTAKIRYDSLLNGIENNYPAYHTLKYKKNYIEANQLMKLMAPGKAVLEYLVGTDNIYAFLITHNSVDVVTMANEAAATINASALREGLVSRDMEKYSKNAIAFYERIFKPVEPLIQQHQVSALTVIPDGFISYIPLEALISDMQGDQYRYLLQDYTFNYQFSAGLIPEYRNVRRPASGKQFLGFAPSFGTPTSAPESLSPLAFAREEVEFISTRFHGENFLDLTATETNFKSNAPYYNIVHIATHAVIDDDNADLSRLYFSIPGDSTDDGRLHAYELFNMQIQASLITLSACNTGVGTLHKGEGVMSLSRAFAYAGCPSIVTSLWQAQDKSTAAIMKYFYENLAAGADKASALRQAKLQYLQDADKVKAIPFYWAGFILVGDESPLNRPINYAWFLLTAPALVIVLYGFRKFRKRNNVVAS